MPDGSIIAFEGESDLVSTQLRLLPTSSQVLILPGLHCYIGDDHPVEGEHFDLPGFIRSVHNALLERTKQTRAFVDGASPSKKRLAFWNGGASQAQAICIKAIMTHQTDGDDKEAEEIFNHVVKAGLANMEAQWSSWKSQSCLESRSSLEKRGSDKVLLNRLDLSENELSEDDPISKAMKAADALDRETESLQPSTELDLTITTRARSNSLPVYGYDDIMDDSAPFLVFGTQNQHFGAGPHTPSMNRTFAHQSPNYTTAPLDGKSVSDHHSPLASHEASRAADSRSGKCELAPDTPSTSKLDEFFAHSHSAFDPRTASLRSRQTSALSTYSDLLTPGGLHPPPHRRIKSMDSLHPSLLPGTPRYAQSFDDSNSLNAVATPTPRVETFGYAKRITPASRSKTDEVVPKLPSIGNFGSIRLQCGESPLVLEPVPKHRKRRIARSSYVDKGTDAIIEEDPVSAFEPVLPLQEHLVVYFKESITDLLVERAVEAYRSGTYPIIEVSELLVEAQQSDTAASSNTTQIVYSLSELAGNLNNLVPPVLSPPLDTREDSISSHNAFPQLVSRHNPRVAKSLNESLPTPERTPTPSLNEQLGRFHDFAVEPDSTAVAVQNALRAVLNDYFPPGSTGDGAQDHNLHFSLLPELEGLWQPIFREAEAHSPRKNNRRMDQIFAVGSQKSVNKEFATNVTGQLEKLGTKAGGQSRSGRLDFRYLLANAMQAFTAQPLAKQTSENPFGNPYLLASLLVPQLETYLALHSEVRYLLLEYPSEHLSTVVAMQKLVGVDLMKVAQIIDSSSKERLPFTHIRGASITSLDNGSNPHRAHRHSPSSSQASDISKANFLLTSNASEAEINTFITAVSKVLIGVSNFYRPEPQIKTTYRHSSRPTHLQTTFSPFPRTSRSGCTTPNTPRQFSPLSAARTFSPTATTFVSSPTAPPSDPSSTARPSLDKNRGHERHKSAISRASRWTARADDGASVYTFDPEDDSDYDMEERRLMPIFLQKPKRPRESRKAMQFLGLA